MPSSATPHASDSPDAPGCPDAPDSPDAFAVFDDLLREAMTGAERFGHRQHVRLTWLAVRRHGAATALGLIGDGIRRTATKAGAPQKFHVTMTRAWVELVAHHADGAPAFEERENFEAFAARHPELLDKELLARHYRPGTLASEQARTSWVEPDLTPFPWADQPS
ncbi:MULTISPECIES: hypothetical protein [unclassified Kitasatospora]|uniref:hypothetical protein n=1 Tax=unclassified Kitasatospora TaxID=2633591 RepID=UPI0033E35E99